MKKAAFKGFTLTEVMVVLVILGALALILIPNFAKMMPDDHNIKYKKALYTIQEIMNDIVNDPNICTGTDTDGNIIPNNEFLKSCRDNNLRNAIAERLSTTEDIDTTISISDKNDIKTTNGMRWLFENHASYPVLESRAAATNKSAFRITVDVNPSNSDLTSTPAASICTFVGNLNSSGTGVFCYRNNVIYDTLPNAANVNGVFNLENAKSQDTFQFLVDEKGKIISISPVGWAILEDNSQLD